MPLPRRSRVRQRAAQLTVLNAPAQREPDAELPAPRVPPRVDAPEILLTRPSWWLVHRLELWGPGVERWVLIRECRYEDEAMKFALSQASGCRVSKRGVRGSDWFSGRPARLVSE
jgi:hypothetical protein